MPNEPHASSSALPLGIVGRLFPVLRTFSATKQISVNVAQTHCNQVNRFAPADASNNPASAGRLR